MQTCHKRASPQYKLPKILEEPILIYALSETLYNKTTLKTIKAWWLRTITATITISQPIWWSLNKRQSILMFRAIMNNLCYQEQNNTTKDKPLKLNQIMMFSMRQNQSPVLMQVSWGSISNNKCPILMVSRLKLISTAATINFQSKYMKIKKQLTLKTIKK